MNSDVVISAEGLGKKYRLGAQTGERYTALRDVIANSVSAPFRRMRNGSRSKIEDRRSQSSNSQLPTSASTDEFWALRDINFEVKRGEVLGIIGRNGAGKSTLLKILSRITDPTEGRVRIKGRVASLLEVGTGFHPELTGRENIYLNGAILGMARAEIKAKFDEIVAFAEVEKFLDTPVKRYSSGMYVRLAFAVAAHLEPEILIIDEVLAVGDTEFQKKCLGKMDQVAQGGRTVLFVSHNMAQIRKLTGHGLLLNDGTISFMGPTDEAIQRYLESGVGSQGIDISLAQLSSPSHGVLLGNFELGCLNGERHLRTGQACEIKMEATFEWAIQNPGFIVSLGSLEGCELLRISTSPISGVSTGLCSGRVECSLRIEDLPLAGGTYSLAVGMSIPNVDYIIPITEVGRFLVESSDYYQSGFAMENRFGLIVAQHRWSVRHLLASSASTAVEV